jgi:hypothetical protein
LSNILFTESQNPKPESPFKVEAKDLEDAPKISTEITRKSEEKDTKKSGETEQKQIEKVGHESTKQVSGESSEGNAEPEFTKVPLDTKKPEESNVVGKDAPVKEPPAKDLGADIIEQAIDGQVVEEEKKEESKETPEIKVQTPPAEEEEKMHTVDLAKPVITDEALTETLNARKQMKVRKTMTPSTKSANTHNPGLLSQSSKGYTAGSSDYDYSANSFDSPGMGADLRHSMFITNDKILDNSGHFTPELPYNAENNGFSVSDPVMGSPVTYLVRGIDNEGVFEVSRRYNDFYGFYKTLLARFPGIYIPPIPPKKAGVNKDEKNLRERKIFLEKFIRVLGENEFIVQSDEFKVFSRHNGNLEKIFKILPNQTSEMLLNRF